MSVSDTDLPHGLPMWNPPSHDTSATNSQLEEESKPTTAGAASAAQRFTVPNNANTESKDLNFASFDSVFGGDLQLLEFGSTQSFIRCCRCRQPLTMTQVPLEREGGDDTSEPKLFLDLEPHTCPVPATHAPDQYSRGLMSIDFICNLPASRETDLRSAGSVYTKPKWERECENRETNPRSAASSTLSTPTSRLVLNDPVTVQELPFRSIQEMVDLEWEQIEDQYWQIVSQLMALR